MSELEKRLDPVEGELNSDRGDDQPAETRDDGHGPMSFLDFVDHIIPLRLMGLLPKKEGGH